MLNTLFKRKDPVIDIDADQYAVPYKYRHFFIEHRFIKNGQRIIVYLYLMTFIVLALTSVFYMRSWVTLNNTIQALQVQNELAASREALENSQYKDVYGILNTNLLNQRLGFYTYLRKLSSLKVDNLWLTDFSIYIDDRTVILQGLYNWPDAPDIYVNDLTSRQDLFMGWVALLKRGSVTPVQNQTPAERSALPSQRPETFSPAPQSFTIFLYQ